MKHIKLCLFVAMAINMQSVLAEGQTKPADQKLPPLTTTTTAETTKTVTSETTEEVQEESQEIVEITEDVESVEGQEEEKVSGEVTETTVIEDMPAEEIQPYDEEVVEFDEDGNEIVKKVKEAPKDKNTAASLSNAKAVEGTKKTAPIEIKTQKSHEMELLTPMKRKDVDFNKLAIRPCGGTKIGRVHYETTPGSRNMVGWKVTKPDPTGTCVLRISDSPKEDDFQVVQLTDKSQNDDGTFPCGRNESPFEGHEFKLPRDFVCDTCILQMEWRTEEGYQYRCVDFESTPIEIPECFGKCMNGGICKNGICSCEAGFEGVNCQYEVEQEEAVYRGPTFFSKLVENGQIVAIYGGLILIIILLFWGAYYLWQKIPNLSREEKDRSDKLTDKTGGAPNESSRYRPSDLM